MAAHGGQAPVEIAAEVVDPLSVVRDLFLPPAVCHRPREGDQCRRRNDQDPLTGSKLE